jgi:hypothetical protein
MRSILIGHYEDNPNFSGWVEGTRNDGTRWIMYLDETGSPVEYFGYRDESGAILGDPIDLSQ